METSKFHFYRPMTIIQNRIEWKHLVAASLTVILKMMEERKERSSR